MSQCAAAWTAVRRVSGGLAGPLDDAEHGALRVADNRDPADRCVERLGLDRPAQHACFGHGRVCVRDSEVHVPVVGHAGQLRRGGAGDLLAGSVYVPVPVSILAVVTPTTCSYNVVADASVVISSFQITVPASFTRVAPM